MYKPPDFKALRHMINHMFLPIQLPHNEDDHDQLELAKVAASSLQAFRNHIKNASDKSAIDRAIAAVLSIVDINSGIGNVINEKVLLKKLRKLEDGYTIAMNIAAQNAAVMITREGDKVIFEAFELSPPNQNIMTTKGRLIREFPAKAVVIKADLLQGQDYTETIASTLSRMSKNVVPQMEPRSSKSGKEHQECRDTLDPFIVVEVFLGALQGKAVQATVTSVVKRTRDDVLWDQTLLPWRRSSMWLLLKVCTHLVSMRATNGSHQLYKMAITFTLSRMLHISQTCDVPQDLLYCMGTKISRRLVKAQQSQLLDDHDNIIRSIRSVLEESSKVLSQLWQDIQRDATQKLDLTHLQHLDFEQGTKLCIPSLDKHILAITSRKTSANVNVPLPTSQALTFPANKLPVLSEEGFYQSKYTVVNLQAFETWVAEHLQNFAKLQDCTRVAGFIRPLMERYHELASRVYSCNPEGISIMLLTILELWVACDKATVEACSMLADYDCGISLGTMSTLLLKSLDEMERLQHVEAHLTLRAEGESVSLIFAERHKQSFSNRYYDHSPSHQQCMELLLQKAEDDRAMKRAEYRQLREKYDGLTRDANDLSHEYEEVIVDRSVEPPETETQHSRSCYRCSLETRANELSIHIHEWPLPADVKWAKTVVFELDVPDHVAEWRSCRAYLLGSVFEGEAANSTHLDYCLSNGHSQLSDAFRERRAANISLRSETKPARVTHYKEKKVSTSTEDDVCVPNGLTLQYHDTRRSAHPNDIIIDHSAVSSSCTYSVTHPSLISFIHRPASMLDGQPPNVVYATQDNAPTNMSVEHYRDLAGISYGCHLQWINLIREMAMCTIDMKSTDTLYFYLQSMYQSGPPDDKNDTRRQSHTILNSERAQWALSQVKHMLSTIQHNWECDRTLFMLSAMSARILALNSDVDALAVLADTRDVASEWVNHLQEKAYQARTEHERKAFQERTLLSALVCVTTFDVGYTHLQQILADATNASILIKMAVMIHDCDTNTSYETSLENILRFRFNRLLGRAHKFLKSSLALHTAVKGLWSTFEPNASWSVLDIGSNHWMECHASATEKLIASVVHIDLLTGELLVNGAPMDQPPEDYRNQSLYRTLFGTSRLTVLPANNAGFRFSVDKRIQQYAVELGMNGTKLVVYACDAESALETIPSKHFKGILPSHFVHDFVHWYDHHKDIVIFRIASNPWRNADDSTWQLTRKSHDSPWTLSMGTKLVNMIPCSTSRTISSVLAPLAEDSHIHCVLNTSCSRLEVELPRLSLNFHLTNHSELLRSQEYPDMVVDSSQDIGTLFGLVNKLCLRNATTRRRRLLVPDATIQYESSGRHVSVTLSKKAASRYHAYDVDEQLQCLKDQGDTSSKLFLAYLHGLTSHFLSDPLLAKTGFEQALTILDSASLRSFDCLNASDCNLLRRIATLTPSRAFYPTGLQVMQTVTWDSSLSSLVQHELFANKILDIIAQMNELSVFAGVPAIEAREIAGDRRLRDRALQRSASVRVSEYGAELHSTAKDVIYSYQSRSIDRGTAAKNISLITALLGAKQESRISEAVLNLKIWTLLPSLVCGKDSKISVTYDENLLDEPTGAKSCLQNLPSLQQWLQNTVNREQRPLSIAMFFATLAAAPKADAKLLEAMALFSLGDSFSNISAPSFSHTNLSCGVTPTLKSISNRIKDTYYPLHRCPEANMERYPREKLRQFNNRQDLAWQRKKDSALDLLARHFLNQWPRRNLSQMNDTGVRQYIDMTEAADLAQAFFQEIHKNIEFDKWIKAITRVISKLPMKRVDVVKTLRASTEAATCNGFISQDELFSSNAPRFSSKSDSMTHFRPSNIVNHGRVAKLQLVLSIMVQHDSSNRFQKEYLQDLQDRLTALPTVGQQKAFLLETTSLPDFQEHQRLCSKQVSRFYDELLLHTQQISGSQISQLTYQWPRVSPSFFLKQLSRKQWKKLATTWRLAIIQYGIALTALQRANRLLEKFDRPDLVMAELRNSGHENWDPMDFPETLLIEIESNILIRNEQEIVAAEMRCPTSGQNTVTQLNMGAGKSSTIIPIVAASLGARGQLVRVVVGKPQSKQMAQMLISKLGGLVNRRIAYMPFSRSLHLESHEAQQIRRLIEKYTEEGTILLLQPEHLLSFKLMIPECFLADRTETGGLLAGIQDFLELYSRDLVDESDENFSVKFELIYTHGQQQLIDGAPDRWLLAQQVLDIVPVVAREIHKTHPHYIELAPHQSGCFPRMRLLHEDAGIMLNNSVASYICNNGLDNAHISRFSAETRAAVCEYISVRSITQVQIDAVECSTIWTEQTKRYLYLLRGIVAGDILNFVFAEKRWRVNYGLTERHPASQLAVPYSAKDRPSLRSEFSHPDVAIMFTLLSYYYSGLTPQNMFDGFKHLMISDGADSTYGQWTRFAIDLPQAFKKLSSVNLNDGPQCRFQLFPALRSQKAVVDFFVANMVFAKECKDFPYKLSASGWDIGKVKSLPTTGFSGTNDSRLLLPLDVHHLDLPSQKATNAVVLEHLLMSENLVVNMQGVSVTSVAEALLDMVINLQPPVQVVLDVGAQVIELSNLQFAEQWLSRHSATKQAVIYVDEADEICVLDRQGRTESFQTSSFASRSEVCLVFLDECHTRGIDIRLPKDYRAAVTLGSKLTKDRLVQACMRMRQLGEGQTLTFIVPTEISAKIRSMKGHHGDQITPQHIVRWTINETFTEISRCMPLWAKQGQRFITNEDVWSDRLDQNTAHFTQERAEKLLEQEAMTITERYAPRLEELDDIKTYAGTNQKLMEIASRLEDFSDQVANATALHEEQERELASEEEHEREVQKPPGAKPKPQHVHRDVLAFAMNGVYREESEAYLPAFHTMEDTSAPNGFKVKEFRNSGQLLVTREFAQVIESSTSDETLDSYQRTVQWLIASRDPHNSNQVKQLLIISPHEAEQLLPRMYHGQTTSLHVFKARTNTAYPPMEKLDFFIQPRPQRGAHNAKLSPELEVMLILFSGQLYLSSYEQYLELCRYIGVCPTRVTKEMEAAGYKTDSEGWILSDEKKQVGGGSGLEKSPLGCLRTYIGKIRRIGEDCNKTHLGTILRGGILQEDEFRDKDMDRVLNGETLGSKESLEQQIAAMTLVSKD